MTIIEKLKHLNIVGSIVVMPDFFVDRIIRLDSKEKLFHTLTAKAERGGGSIRGIPTTDIIGGNAVNVAYCLAKLGIKVALFTVADEIGAIMTRQAFAQFGDKVTLRISSGKSGLTTCFEFPHEGTWVNVMVSDIGDNANFGPERISEVDLGILKNADGVMLVNWASNIKGTELAEFVFRNSPSAFHFIDPADIETRKQDFRDALKEKLTDITDCLSINENECNSLSDALGLGHLLTSSYGPDEVRAACKSLADSVGISTDLHTRIGSAWSNGKESVFVHAIKVEAKTLTGAGDSWDAADIVGYLAGLEPKERLLFTNCCASLYIRDPNGEPPTMNKVFELIEYND